MRTLEARAPIYSASSQDGGGTVGRMELSAGSTLVLSGAWAWTVAVYLSCCGPMPAGRGVGRAMRALLGTTAAATMLLVSGLVVLVVGGLL